MLDTATVVIFACVFCLSFYIMNTFVSSPRKNYPPSVGLSFPFVGHLPLLGSNPLITYKRWRNTFGNIYSLKLGSWRAVVLNGHDVIKEAMISRYSNFASRPRFVQADLWRNVYGGHDGLIFHPFNKSFLQMRRLAITSLHTFTHDNLSQTQELILDETYRLIHEFASRAGEPLCIDGDLSLLVSSIMYQLIFGRGESITADKNFKLFYETTNELVEFNKTGNPINVMPWLRHLMPLTTAHLLRIMKKVVSKIPPKVQVHEEHFCELNLKDITDCLLAAKLPEEVDDKTSKLSKDGLLLPVLNELMLTAQETTSITLSWLILYMIGYPDVQERVHREIDEVIGSGRNVNATDRPKLAYTEATIYEVMRITSIVPLALPHSTVNDTKLNGFDIDKDTVIFVNLRSVNMDASLWKDPEEFRPERLMKNKNELLTDKCNRILSFGLGIRRCVGEKLAKLLVFVIFTNLMQRFKFESADADHVDLAEVPGIVYKPKQTKIVMTSR